MPLNIPNIIENDTPADAAELRQNFDAIQAYTNTYTVLRDGSVAMTNPLVLSGDPTQDSHAANKGYVDGKNALYLPLAGGTVSGATIFSAGTTFNEDLTLGAAADLLLPTATSKIGFGSRLGQHIDLFAASYGIGVQSGAMYFRTADNGAFRFFHGGAHSDTGGAAGTGGVESVSISETALVLPTVQSTAARAAVHYDYVNDTFHTQAEADARYVNVAGDTMTGELGVDSLNVCATTPTTRGVEVSTVGQLVSRYNSGTITSPSMYMYRGGVNADANGRFIQFERSAGTTFANPFTLGYIRVNTGENGVAYDTVSDYRLKTEIGPVADAVDRVGRLRPIRFAWNTNGYEQDGFLAHEVADVVPAAVSGEKDAVDEDGEIDPQGLDASNLVPLLVAAVQELAARVAELEAVS